MMNKNTATVNNDPRPDKKKAIRTGCLAASFFIFAIASLIIHEQQRNEYVPERSSIAAALSYVAYNAPLGAVYSGVQAKFLSMDARLEKTLDEASRQKIAPGVLVGATSDGNGVAYIVFTSLSMLLLGPQMSSIVLGMLALMAISATMFVWRFRDQHGCVVILYFTSLTVMLFTPLVWDYPANFPANISIGGIRYFSLLAIIPGFHLLLELTAGRRFALNQWQRSLVPTAVQVVLLTLAVLVRASAGSAVVALALVGLFTAWKVRHERGALARLAGQTAYMTVVAGLFIGLLILPISKEYLREGRFTEVVWHRILLSLALNPNWGFTQVDNLYDCKRFIPAGLTGGFEDQNAHCIWWDYVTKHHIPVDVASTMTYGREYDKAMREAFFDIARLYPRETIETFLYYKPLWILEAIKDSFSFQIPPPRRVMTCLLIAALGNLVAYVLSASRSRSLTVYKRLAAATALFAACNTMPYIAVWAKPYTIADLLLYCLFGVGLFGLALVESVRTLTQRTLRAVEWRSSGLRALRWR
jgi:hypothetical protein